MQLIVGATVIPYTVRESTEAARMRIVVTPGAVEVVAPAGTPLDGPEGVLAFVQRKRRWVFDAVREIEEKHRAALTQQYGSGAKLQYRGRGLMLDVQPGDVAEVAITCRSKFHVIVPAGLGGVEKLEAVRGAFDAWLRDRALDAVERLGHRHEMNLDVKAAGYRVSDARSRWGSCGRDGVVRVHWRLVQAPAAALEYVVAHEVAHLVHRNHSAEFWLTLGRTLPDWAERKAMLERWEGENGVAEAGGGRRV
ncbi:MAG: SprT family zinc-dependent metalloprotease [Pseudomonadota bacterium]|nr:SprT family zinc-dependent metalloprotease [Pseudomonadota bacterium]